MRYCILTDIHSNIEALDAALKDSEQFHPDKYICLGDVVGYGPSPNECVERITSASETVLMGNHDAAVIENISTENFNPAAYIAIRFNREMLNSENIAKIRKFELTKIIDIFHIAHGSLINPLSEYIINNFVAYSSFKIMSKNLLFFGHTHKPVIYNKKKNEIEIKTSVPEIMTEIFLNENEMYIINPGSVGQPRDRDNRGAFVVFDTDKLSVIFRRFEYDYKKTQKLMIEKNFPERLVNRLALGK